MRRKQSFWAISRVPQCRTLETIVGKSFSEYWCLVRQCHVRPSVSIQSRYQVKAADSWFNRTQPEGGLLVIQRNWILPCKENVDLAYTRIRNGCLRHFQFLGPVTCQSFRRLCVMGFAFRHQSALLSSLYIVNRVSLKLLGRSRIQTQEEMEYIERAIWMVISSS